MLHTRVQMSECAWQGFLIGIFILAGFFDRHFSMAAFSGGISGWVLSRLILWLVTIMFYVGCGKPVLLTF
jgi:hypothetical protein